MKFYYMTFRSVTFAQKGERILQKAGIRCFLLRTPKWMEQRGCSYCLRLWTDDISPALDLIRQENLPLGRIYRQGPDGQLEERPL